MSRIAVLQRGAPDQALAARAIAEAIVLASFDGASYKTGERDAAAVADAFVLCTSAGPEVRAAVERGRLLGECCNQARSLANEPGNALPPRVLADRARTIAESAGVEIDVYDERQLEELGMGLVLGVGRGSVEPPRLITMRYTPSDAPPGPTLGLVGKGVTFDSGGVSIKPADNMERMKDDMAGAAAVICAMRAIATLKAPIRVVGVAPAAENMPDGRAIRPGDVLRAASGATVEVLNTDAEGRLLVADGLWFARRMGATHLVDVATLTGACVVALGYSTSGLFGAPDAWVDLVKRTADLAGDRVWPMPTFDDYRDQLKSEIADIANTGGRPAGAITAAVFLKEFAGGVPWAHLDIAGTAWAVEAQPWQPKGATGATVRTLAELAFTRAGDWPS
jgi:leucyl aminopeptidase